MFVAAPILVLTARRLRTPIVAIALPAMIWWQWSPGLDGIARAGRDPSSAAAYHQPLIAAVRPAGGPAGRIEVVPDATALGDGVRRRRAAPGARLGTPARHGPQRHLLRRRRSTPTPITAGCATTPCGTSPSPTCRSTRSAAPEAELVRGGLPFLEPVWHDDHWQLWRVVDAEPLVEGPARLVELGPTAVVLDVTAPEPVLVRVRYSSHWSLDVPGCVEPSPDGWTTVQRRAAGHPSPSPGPGPQPPLIGRARRLAIRDLGGPAHPDRRPPDPDVTGGRQIEWGRAYSVDLVELDDVDLQVVDDEVLDAAAELPAVGLVHRRFEHRPESPVAERLRSVRRGRR